jgi:hypothetical protein
MNKAQFETLLEFFIWYQERGLSPAEAFVEAEEDYIFIYGDGTTPQGILGASELKEVRPAE